MTLAGKKKNRKKNLGGTKFDFLEVKYQVLLANVRVLQWKEKSYQILIAREDRILYMYLCFTLSINFESSNSFYDDHITCIRRVSLV
jgi:hypothetical protein